MPPNTATQVASPPPLTPVIAWGETELRDGAGTVALRELRVEVVQLSDGLGRRIWEAILREEVFVPTIEFRIKFLKEAPDVALEGHHRPDDRKVVALVDLHLSGIRVEWQQGVGVGPAGKWIVVVGHDSIGRSAASQRCRVLFVVAVVVDNRVLNGQCRVLLVPTGDQVGNDGLPVGVAGRVPKVQRDRLDSGN